MSEISIGTQVVLREDIAATSAQPAFSRGSIGMVVKAPTDTTHSWWVRFPDGGEGAFRRDKICTLDAWQRQDINQPASFLNDYNLDEYVCYHCIVGSKAYGLNHAGSDTDHRGIYLPPADLHWSLYGVPEQLENKESDVCFWEYQKFITLALKANPNILECIYTDLIERKTALIDPLLENRHIFLSRLAYQTYNGYVMAQFKKMTNRKERTGEINWKNAMHLIRLLYSGIGVLEENRVIVNVGDRRDELLEIRHGHLPWEALEAKRQELHRRFDAALEQTKLPERPDFAKANALLVEARHAMVR